MRFACAEYHGPIPNRNQQPPINHMGLVLHIMEGDNIEGADSWFRNPDAQASSNFGVARDGRLWQWVDTDDEIAWAQGYDGNRHFVSVECAGVVGTPTGSLTQPMVESLARLYAEGVRRYGWPVSMTDNPVNPGLGWHGMGAASGRPDWGHPACPGELIKAQRPLILSRVRALLGATPAVPTRPVPLPVPVVEDVMAGHVVLVVPKDSGGQWALWHDPASGFRRQWMPGLPQEGACFLTGAFGAGLAGQPSGVETLNGIPAVAPFPPGFVQPA